MEERFSAELEASVVAVAARAKLKMSSLLAVFFCSFWIIAPVTDASPTVSPGPDHHQLSSSDCVSCSLTQVPKNSSSPGGQGDMVEAVKRHILNMLHLSARPNLTQPVPRSALLNAIKKLHVGRVAEDGSVEMPEDLEGPGALAPPEPAAEVITFGYPGEWSSAPPWSTGQESSTGAWLMADWDLEDPPGIVGL